MMDGYGLSFEVKEMLEMALPVGSDKWKVDEIEDWLRPRVKKA